MNVKRIADFTTEEVEALKAAGNILGNIARAGSNNEFDELTPEAVQLIYALKDVLTRIMGE